MVLHDYHKRKLSTHLEIYFGPPEEFFLEPDTQDEYTQGRLVPILDDGNFGLVSFYDRDKQSIVSMDVECPGESRTEYVSWQQYLGDLLVRIGESIDADTDWRAIAELVESN